MQKVKFYTAIFNYTMSLPESMALPESMDQKEKSIFALRECYQGLAETPSPWQLISQKLYRFDVMHGLYQPRGLGKSIRRQQKNNNKKLASCCFMTKNFSFSI